MTKKTTDLISTFHILCAEPTAYDAKLRRLMESHCKVTYKDFQNSEDMAYWQRENHCDAIICGLGIEINSSVIKSSSNLKLIATPTTGLNHIDITEAKNRGIRVISLKGEIEFLRKITTTAEHAWLLLLASNRLLPSLLMRVAKKSWKRSDLTIQQLSGSVIGIIGMGRLGKIIGSYGTAFRMRVVYSDKDLGVEADKEFESVDLVSLLRISDHIILSASYEKGDGPIIGLREVQLMKPGCTFINIARGELVDEDAIIYGLNNSIIRAVGLDVLKGDSCWDENISIKSRLVDMAEYDPRVLITPHVGGYARQAIESTREFIIHKVVECLKIPSDQDEIHCGAVPKP